MKADKIITKINSGEYFGSDFASMQGSNKTGNELLAGVNKNVSSITANDALNLFRIATQNKNPGTAREVGFSETAEALLKSYVDSLSPQDRKNFEAEIRKQQGGFTHPGKHVVNMFSDRNLLKKLTGLSTLNENLLDYNRLVTEAQRVRGEKSDTETGQVNTFTASQMGTNVTEQGENTGYGTAIGSNTTFSDFIDADGDGVDDRYQAGPGQPYNGPSLDPNETTTESTTDAPTTDVASAQAANPNSFGNVVLQGVYNMVPVKDKWTGEIRYIQQPVTSYTGTRNFGGIYR